MTSDLAYMTTKVAMGSATCGRMREVVEDQDNGSCPSEGDLQGAKVSSTYAPMHFQRCPHLSPRQCHSAHAISRHTTGIARQARMDVDLAWHDVAPPSDDARQGGGLHPNCRGKKKVSWSTQAFGRCDHVDAWQHAIIRLDQHFVRFLLTLILVDPSGLQGNHRPYITA